MRRQRPCLSIYALAVLFSATGDLCAQRQPPPLGGKIPASVVPYEAEGVEVVQKIGNELPLNLAFLDSRGKAVKLGDYFKTGRPVLLTLNYSRCPRQCSSQLNLLTDRLSGMKLRVGKDFEVVTVSIDAAESPRDAATARDKYHRRLTKKDDPEHWSFLVGRGRAVRGLTEAVGYRFKYLPKQDIYSHPSVNIVCTPDGVISSYLSAWAEGFPKEGNPQLDLTTALRVAARGEESLPWGDAISKCFAFDPDRGEGVAAAIRIMKIGGALMIVFLAVLFPVLGMKARRKAMALEAVPAPETT